MKFSSIAASLILASALVTACSHGYDAFSGTPRTAAERVSDATLYSNTSPPDGTTVCTFDRTKVLIAYYKSDKLMASMRELVVRYDQAKEAGDAAAQAACRREGEARQALAHRQLAGQAPLTNIASDYRDAINTIARNSNASLIIARDAYSGGHSVDVTKLLVQAMPAAQKPAPKSELVPPHASS